MSSLFGSVERSVGYVHHNHPLRKKVESCPTLFIDQRAKATWRSLNKMMDTPTGWPVDRYIVGRHELVVQTKPTNIAMGLLSIIGAVRIGILSPEAAEERLRRILESLITVKRRQVGQTPYFYDWYDVNTLQIVERWPEGGHSIEPFISTVDNSWLFLSLLFLQKLRPDLTQIVELLDGIDFEEFFNSETQSLRGGFDLYGPSTWHYSRNFLSESRITHYVTALLSKPNNRENILDRLKNHAGELPQESYGGSMFEVLMPTLLFDEPYFSEPIKKHVQAQMSKSTELGGIWAVSVCDDVDGKYGERGVGGRYISDEVVSPHAGFLPLYLGINEGVANLKNMEQIPDAYSDEDGYADGISAIAKKSSPTRLCLDQGMIFISSVNELTGGFFKQVLDLSSEQD